MNDHETMLCEAAACMWECALAWAERNAHGFRDYQEGWGTASLRMEVIQHAAELERDYQSVKDDYTMSFDWDFVPEWMERNLVMPSPAESSITLTDARHIPTA